MGATKTRDRMGLAGTRSRVLAFGTFESRVPGFDVIAITDLIYFSSLAMNDRERMCIVLAGLIDLIQSIYQNYIYVVLLSNISLKCIIIYITLCITIYTTLYKFI